MLLDQLVADVRTGIGRVLVLHGEAGIGKTVLLDYLAEQAGGCRVIRATGVEAEQELAYAGLHQVCLPLLGLLENLPRPQQTALRAAFGLVVGEPPDRFLLGLAVLGLLSEAEAARPLMCLVDDAQWLDMASAQVLGFAARRLGAESVAIVFAIRDNDRAAAPALANLPDLRVPGLPDEDARRLLLASHTGPVDERVVERIVAESNGNPLTLLELPRGFTPGELAGGFGLVANGGVPGRIEESFRRQVDSLSPMTRQVLLVAAAEPVGDPVLVWRAAERLGIGVDPDLASRETAERFAEFGSRVRFRHPLLRSTVYRTASPDDRRKAHWALAEVTDPVADPDRRSWHRAQASSEPDEDVAVELEDSASRAETRGGPAAAAAFLERAAELTPEPEQRSRRLLHAAEASFRAGMSDAAAAQLALAQAGPLDERQRAAVGLLQARIAFATGRGAKAPQLLAISAGTLERLEPLAARDIYLDALQAAWFTAHLSAGPPLRRLATSASSAPAPHTAHEHVGYLLDGLAARYKDGFAAGAPLLRGALDRLIDASAREQVGVRCMWFACVLAMDLWDDNACDVLSLRFVQMARDTGVITSLPFALADRLVVLTLMGELSEAGWLLEEFGNIREAIGILDLPYAAPLHAVWCGHEERATSLIDASARDAVARGEGIGVLAADWMRALLANSLGRYDDALAAAMRATSHPQEMGIMTSAPLVELVTAAARTGRLDLADDAVERLAEAAMPGGTDWALGVLARCRAMASTTNTADMHYRDAIDRLGRTRIRTELARAHLHYGEWLRRHSRRAEAREQLRTAHSLFVDMGMDAFATLTAHELGVAGETARKRAENGPNELTSQEMQIVRLVREGLSNAEIAVRLFISPRTVEWHLGKIFVKLGITSRRQLRR